MLNSGPLINAHLIGALADLRHGDLLVVADAGLPVPAGTPTIDLSLVPGVPSFEQVTRAILAATVIESAVVAREASDCEPVTRVRADLTCREITHDEFKLLVGTARWVVRTGEHTPYANVALVAGVAF